jgi:phage terminase Nu1 subunit (DNA packaging protein)
MPHSEILSKSELAQELMVSCARVSQLVQRGMPVLPSGKVDLEECCRWILSNLDPITNNDQGVAYERAWQLVDELFDSKPVRRSTRQGKARTSTV